jgi:GTP-binding protein EngB required for normal cell division
MKSILYLILFIFFIQASNAQNKTFEAYGYNQMIINEQIKVERETYYFTTRVTELNLKILIHQIKKSIKTIENATIFNNETIYRDAALQQFTHYLSTAQTEYTQILKLVEDIDLDEKDYRSKLKELTKSIATNDKKANQIFSAEQEKFAKKYGLKLE